MSDPNSDTPQQNRSPFQRVVEVARQGQARLNAYRQETAVLGTWLRSHLFRQGSKAQQTNIGRSLRHSVSVRCLRQRQEVHRNGRGDSSTAIHALHRATQAVHRKKP